MRSEEKDFRSAIAVEGTALSRVRPLAPPDCSRNNRLITSAPPATVTAAIQVDTETFSDYFIPFLLRFVSKRDLRAFLGLTSLVSLQTRFGLDDSSHDFRL